MNIATVFATAGVCVFVFVVVCVSMSMLLC